MKTNQQKDNKMSAIVPGFWMDKACEDIHLAFLIHDLEHLCKKVSIKFNNQMTTSAGNARYSASKKRIHLSAKIWARMNEEERTNTSVHEACHIILAVKHPDTYLTMDPHGYEWCSLMDQCGIKPERFHNTDIKGLRKTYSVSCHCGNITSISSNRRTRMFNSTRTYVCKRCKSQILLINQGEEDLSYSELRKKKLCLNK